VDESALAVPVGVQRQVDVEAQDRRVRVRHQHGALAVRDRDAVACGIDVKPRARPVLGIHRQVAAHLLVDYAERLDDLVHLRPGVEYATERLVRLDRDERHVGIRQSAAGGFDEPVTERARVSRR
jgi:hypothetical protein